MIVTRLAALKAAEGLLAAAGIETARLDAEILMSHLMGCSRPRLHLDGHMMVADGDLEAFEAMIARRRTGEPVAYLTGEQEFWSLSFRVSPDTLIPRPDTEMLVDLVLKRAQHPTRILDLGTGTGCILLSLLSEYPAATGVGVDLNAGAVALAAANADALGLAGRALFWQSDWFSAVDHQAGGYDVIVSNPPYIPSADIAGLMPDVRDHEPMGALDGGADGLDPYRILAADAPAFLAAGGLMAVEVGIHQAADVAALWQQAGLLDVQITPDLAGIERVVSGKKTTGR